ncbi:MAG: hypothetical protein CMJ32_09975 [Phycisphaerae bacterium]|nr:hypothetical protein [Phycisphaerae bacterium]
MNDGDTLETLLKVRSAFEAESIVALLADAGIEAHVFDIADIGIPLGLNPTAARVPIQVPAGRIEEARKAIEEARLEASTIDWSTIDVGPTPGDIDRVLAVAHRQHAVSKVLAALGWLVAVACLLLGVIAIVLMFT